MDRVIRIVCMSPLKCSRERNSLFLIICDKSDIEDIIYVDDVRMDDLRHMHINFRDRQNDSEFCDI